MSVSKGKKNELRTNRLLSVLIVVVILFPLIICIIREYKLFVKMESVNFSILNFLVTRYQDTSFIILDSICLAAVLLVTYFVIKINARVRASRIFVEVATQANVPVFVIDSNKQLYWTNMDETDIFRGKNIEECLKNILNGPDAEGIIQNCIDNGVHGNYEIKLKDQDRRFWLQVSITSQTINQHGKMICGTISDISDMKEATEKIINQQRELQMQTEMMALITAQMEVQQAGIQEQNDVLSVQHMKLAEQAEDLKVALSELEKSNNQIITKTSYITDSIKYAQTIQQAMLPDEQQLEHFFDHFIIYKPKDIVSGDFYWLSVSSENVFVVLGDCTGHGVPGAFMSMIGIRILGELINEQKMTRPSVILEAMHERIQTALKQDITENNDGMDIAICKFKKSEVEGHDWDLKYAGAKQPLFIKRKGENDVEVIEADRRGIGGQTIADIFFFEDKDIELNNGDRIYLTSDGIKDQNNIMRKRFSTARFKMLLSMTSTEKIQDQKESINEVIKNWQGLEEQRDDISLWGFELNNNILLEDVQEII